MRPLTIVMLVAALGIAGSTAFLAKRFLANQSAATEAAAMRRLAAKQVLVAAADMKVGHIVADRDLRWQEWPEALISSNFVVRSGGDDLMQAYLGAVVRSPLTNGEPVQASRLFRQDGAGLMAGVLSPGLRAISIEVNAEKAASGFILPGDHVDVVFTYEIKGGSSDPKAEVGARMASETILRDIRVVAVDQTLGEPKDGTVKAKTVTLEVTSKQVEIVALALRLGTITLPLRSLGHAEGVEEPLSYTTDLTLSRGLRDAIASRKKPEPTAPEQPVEQAAPKPAAPQARAVKIYRGGTSATEYFGR